MWYIAVKAAVVAMGVLLRCLVITGTLLASPICDES
jgi:hypothetical protein